MGPSPIRVNQMRGFTIGAHKRNSEFEVICETETLGKFALVLPVLSPKENRKPTKGDAACGDAKCDMGDWRNGIRG